MAEPNRIIPKPSKKIPKLEQKITEPSRIIPKPDTKFLLQGGMVEVFTLKHPQAVCYRRQQPARKICG